MSIGHQNGKGSQNNKIIDRNTVVFRTGNRDPDEYNGKKNLSLIIYLANSWQSFQGDHIQKQVR